MKRKILYFGILMTLLCNCSEKRAIGIINNQLNRCPGSPNCVSSFEPHDSILYVTPIDSGTHLNIDAIAKIIIDTAMKMPRVTLVTNVTSVAAICTKPSVANAFPSPSTTRTTTWHPVITANAAPFAEAFAAAIGASASVALVAALAYVTEPLPQ